MLGGSNKGIFMMISGMELVPWRIDGKRPTNATQNERKAQSLRDKQKNKPPNGRYSRQASKLIR